MLWPFFLVSPPVRRRSFTSVATFTPHRKAAMATFRKRTTDEFWLATAHANGIDDDGKVREAAARNRSTVAGMFRSPSIDRTAGTIVDISTSR